MSASPIPVFWTRFVTADGLGWTAARLALALALSLLFFPFGLVVVVALWALGIPVNPVLPEIHGGEKLKDKTIAKRAGLLFAYGFAIPTLLGLLTNLIPVALTTKIVQAGLELAESSILSSNLREWVNYYSSSPMRGAQYVVTALAICHSTTLLLAQYMRGVSFIVDGLAGAVRIAGKWKYFFSALICALFGGLWAPVLYFKMPVGSSHDLGVVGPGTMLTWGRMPITIVPAWGMLVGAISIWIVIAVMRSRNTRRQY